MPRVSFRPAVTAPLRLVPRSADRAAAEVVLVEAVLTGLPPGGRVLVAGDAARTSWLADALEAVEAHAVCSPLPTAPAGALVTHDDGFDVAVVDAEALDGAGASAALSAVGGALAPHGRLLVQAPSGGAYHDDRSLGAWVRLLSGAGLVLRDVREPAHGGLAGSVFVCECGNGE
jgi:hypothetical protein